MLVNNRVWFIIIFRLNLLLSLRFANHVCAFRRKPRMTFNTAPSEDSGFPMETAVSHTHSFKIVKLTLYRYGDR
jgi:hypothetical protein